MLVPPRLHLKLPDTLSPCITVGVYGFQQYPQAMTRYENIAPAVELSGPTSFAPLIRKAIEIVEDGGRQYHCLVIIADGQV